VREVIERWLQLAGYQTCSASNGKEGLKELYERRPDLVISDIMMPGMDGHEFCGLVREFSNVPIIMLTGLGQISEHAQRANGLHISAFLTKPLSLANFLEKVGGALEKAGPD
jgi:DNA-binding response OmpR family regulator